MAPAREERRLAAILAADMVSYSRLMEADESGTIARQRAYRDEVIDPAIAEHRGRIVKTTGDGLLVEFASAVDAVTCAVAVQRGMAKREPDKSADTHIAYRIGVNIGDVVIDGDDILGDGVNVAARMEGLAPPGGICVSAKVFDEVRNKLGLGFADMGPQRVKNITEPIRSYRVLVDVADAGTVIQEKVQAPRRWWMGVAAAAAVGIVIAGVLWWRPWFTGVDPARAAQMAFPLPKKPSIAVLPFRNLSGDKAQAFLAEGLSENIASALSRISELFVIARRSTLAYRGKDVKIRRVAEELGVRFVLTGSVQRAGQRLRVTAQLIDAIKGTYLWSGRFDRDVKDLFKVQDQITARIVSSLRVRLTEGMQARAGVTGRPIKFKAWELRIKGVASYRKFNKQANLRARRLFQEAVKIDPRYRGAWGWIAWTHWAEVRFLWSKDSAASIAAGKAAARKGIRLNPNDGGAHNALGSLYYLERDVARGLPLIRKAVELNPNFADTIALLAGGLTYAGGQQESLDLVKRAMRLAPGYPAWYSVILCRAQRLTKQVAKAIGSCEAAARRSPRANFFQVELVVTLVAGGKLAKARKAAATVMRNDPKFTVSRWGKFVHYTNPVIQKRFLDALLKAGLPE